MSFVRNIRLQDPKSRKKTSRKCGCEFSIVVNMNSKSNVISVDILHPHSNGCVPSPAAFVESRQRSGMPLTERLLVRSVVSCELDLFHC